MASLARSSVNDPSGTNHEQKSTHSLIQSDSKPGEHLILRIGEQRVKMSFCEKPSSIVSLITCLYLRQWLKKHAQYFRKNLNKYENLTSASRHEICFKICPDYQNYRKTSKISYNIEFHFPLDDKVGAEVGYMKIYIKWSQW